MKKAEIKKKELREKRENVEAKEIMQEIMERIGKKEKEGRRQKIEKFKYNEIYKNIMMKKIPAYLRGRKGKKNRNLVARFRCGNEWKSTLERGERKKM